MSGTGASTSISGQHTQYNDQEHYYEEPINVALPNRTANKQQRTQTTVHQCELPLILAGVNTALICVIVATAVYFTWKSNNETKLTGSIIQKLDEVNLKFKIERKNAHEWRSNYLFGCQRDWMLYEGHCYYFNKNKTQFDNAKDICESLNSSFVKIEDEAENYWLIKYITAATWIGGKQINGTENKFTWLDGTPLVYNGKHESIPDGRSRCLQYWYQFGRYAWDDEECVSARSFVCEKAAHRINVIS